MVTHLPELGGAEILVREVEWAGLGRRFPELNGLLKRHIQLPGLRWTRVTPPPMLFVGDLTYGVGLLARERVPGVGHRDRLRESTRAVNTLRKRYPGLLVLAAHAPAAAGALTRALAR